MCLMFKLQSEGWDGFISALDPLVTKILSFSIVWSAM